MTTTSPFDASAGAVSTRTIGDAEVPWCFTDFEAEYAALRQNAALFDLSSVGVIEVGGADRTDFLQRMVTRDVGFLFPESSVTGLVLDENARPVDLVVVYATDNTFRLETGFGRRERVLAHLSKHAEGDLSIEDLTPDLASLAVEGPYAWRAVDALLGEGTSSVAYQGVAPVSWHDIEITLSRTGYTSEYGYKLFAPRSAGAPLWAELAALASPAGYEVLETAMVEVRQPLLHHESDPGASVLEAGLNWLVDFEKDGYLGREALMDEWSEGCPISTVGALLPAGTTVEAGAPVSCDGTEIGTVAHSVNSPGLGGVVALARVKREWLASGLEIEVATASGAVAGRTGSSPYVIPESWAIAIA